MRSQSKAAAIIVGCVMAFALLPPMAMAEPTDTATPTPTDSVSARPGSPSTTPSSSSPTTPSASTTTASSTPSARALQLVSLDAGQDFTGVVGQPLTVTATTALANPTQAITEVNIGQWSRSQVTTTFTDGAFALNLTYGSNTVGTYQYRVRVDSPSGSVYSDTFTVTRLSTAPTITSAPSAVYTNETGTVQVSVANSGAGASVWTEFWTGAGWSKSQTATTDAQGAATLPLTYGWTSAGSYSWRVVTMNPYRVTTAAAGRKLTRYAAAPIVTSASSYVTTDVTGSVTAHLDGSGAGIAVWTEFWVSGGWSRSQTRTTDTSGNVTIPLTYAATTPGVYGWRIVTHRPAGDAGAKPAYIKRVAPGPTTVPAVWTSCSATLQGVSVSIGRTEHSRIIVNQTSGSYATISYHFRDRRQACAFTTVYVETGRIGSAGLREPWNRTAGDNTTPLGTYTITEAHGQLPNPGTSIAYRQTSTYDYWVWDQSSSHFNTLRDRRLGGFSPARSQRVWDYPRWFTYVLVIGFNRKPVIARSRGGGIRFHESTGTATGGCVALSRANLRTTVQKIVSGDKITIVR